MTPPYRTLFAVFLIFSMFLLGCSRGLRDANIVTPHADAAPTPGERFFISQTDLLRIKEHALRGDVSSINKLVDYYMLYVGDEAQGVAWLERLGDQGDKDAQKNVLNYYNRHPSGVNERHAGDLRMRWGL